MNNQEAIDRLVKHLEYGWSEPTVEAIDMGIHALKENQWIPCSKRMPEEYTNVMVSFAHGTVTEAIYSKDGIFKGMYGDYTTKVIDAWMPLQKPYRPEKGLIKD